MSAANVQIRLRQYRSFWLKPQNKPAYLLGLKPCSLRRANLDQNSGRARGVDLLPYRYCQLE